MDPRHLRDLNAERFKGLSLSSLLMKDTWILTKSLDGYAVPDELKEKTDPRHLVNRVVQIDGEDDYAFWRARAPRRPRDAARAYPRRAMRRDRARARPPSLDLTRAPPPSGTCSPTSRTCSGATSRRSSGAASSARTISRRAATWPRGATDGCWSPRRRAARSMWARGGAT